MDDQFNKFYNQVLRFLSYRSRSEKEVKDNLLKKKAPQEIIDKVILKLREYKFVNDEVFAKSWIEQRIASKPRGMRIIKMELLQKGISKEIIDELIQNFPLRQGFEGQAEIPNEQLMIKKLIEKKLPRYKGLDNQQVKQKLLQYLSSKGFDYNDIKQAMNAVVESENNS